MELILLAQALFKKETHVFMESIKVKQLPDLHIVSEDKGGQ